MIFPLCFHFTTLSAGKIPDFFPRPGVGLKTVGFESQDPGFVLLPLPGLKYYIQHSNFFQFDQKIVTFYIEK